MQRYVAVRGAKGCSPGVLAFLGFLCAWGVEHRSYVCLQGVFCALKVLHVSVGRSAVARGRSKTPCFFLAVGGAVVMG